MTREGGVLTTHPCVRLLKAIAGRADEDHEWELSSLGLDYLATEMTSGKAMARACSGVVRRSCAASRMLGHPHHPHTISRGDEMIWGR